MGKKRVHKKRGEDEDQFSSTASTGTVDTRAGAYGGEDVDMAHDPLYDIVERLYSKRPETRASALTALHTLLGAAVCDEELTNRQLELLRLLGNCIKKGKAEEVTLACRCLGLAVVTLGATEGAEELVRESWETVLGVAKSATKKDDARCAAVDTLAIMCFVAAEGELEAEMWDVLHRLWRAKSGDVQAAAVSGWAFVATTAVGRVLETCDAEEALADVYELLNSEETDVCLAAGEAMALLFHMLNLHDAETEPSASVDGECCLDAAMERVRELARGMGSEGGLRKSKAARRDLKSAFREALALMEDGEPPYERVKMRHGDALELDDPAAVLQLRYLRRFLASAFQEHMQHNALMHEIFDFAPDRAAAPRLTQREKRLYRSPNSAEAKGRSQARGADRAQARLMKCHMMAEDD